MGRTSIASGLIGATVLLAPMATLGETRATTSLRALAAQPELYANRSVTVTGRFRGRVLPGDAIPSPPPPNRSRWDFLLNAEDSAVWVSGIRPAGWDFDLDPLSASDAQRGAWLEVTGTVRVTRRTTRTCAAPPRCRDVWIEASDLRATKTLSGDGPGLPRPGVQSPIVVFNDPIDEEVAVPPSTAVRVQFSKPMLPETFSEHLRIAYSTAPGVTAPPVPLFNATYTDATRSLAITFASPLASHQTVRIELLEGIVAANGLPFEPWAFVFSTGDLDPLPTLPTVPRLPTLKRSPAN